MNANITHAEFAAMAVLFYGQVTPSRTDYFNDIGDTWARDFINYADELGLVGGYSDGGFNPDMNITRAEAVRIINGVLGRRPSINHLHEDMKAWIVNADPDVW